MTYSNAAFEKVTKSYTFSSCSPCYPDEVDETGAQCAPCNPCSPDQLGPGGSQCAPCHPCYPDQRGDDGSQCAPCHPCYPDQRGTGGSQCAPCNPCYPDTSSSSGSSTSCFITSACVESLGLPDNCEELQLLRTFRDKRSLYDGKFSRLVEEYYQIAPKIVESINKSENPLQVFKRIYRALVLPCVSLIKQNRDNEAVELYSSTVLGLKSEYAL